MGSFKPDGSSVMSVNRIPFATKLHPSLDTIHVTSM